MSADPVTSPHSEAAPTYEPVTDLLDALADLRRFWERPDRKRRFLAQLGEPIELGVLRVLSAVRDLTTETEDAPGTDDPAIEGPGIGAVAEALAIDGSTASRLVDQAVSGGHLLRLPGRTDRRRTRLELTPTGADLVDRARSIRLRWLTEITDGWTTDDLTRFAHLLRRFVHDATPTDATPTDATSTEGSST